VLVVRSPCPGASLAGKAKLQLPLALAVAEPRYCSVSVIASESSRQVFHFR
jgi:hypothetical protein